MRRAKYTVHDLLAAKGKHQFAKIRVQTIEEAIAADRAGVEIISVSPAILERPDFRDLVPNAFVIGGVAWGTLATFEDYLRFAYRMINAGGDAIYCTASLDIISKLAAEAIPVIAHVGLIPSHRTWFGGFKAQGKTLEGALQIWEHTKALEDAGAFAAEIEVVPVEIASEISRRTKMFMISMGAGSGCDAQYLFSEDLLGLTEGHVPRHSRRYRNFADEYGRLQNERIAAFAEYAHDCRTGAFPATKETVAADPDVLEAFRTRLAAQEGTEAKA
jgi:3-methyl-2-oxobutanoate hydroxymethyltransferase